MTTSPSDDHEDQPDAPEAPIDDERLAALRALLRDEPVDTDPAATETRILAALDAATAEPVRHGSDSPAVTARHSGRPAMPTPATPTRRPWTARPVLVAAALLAVVGIGAVVWGSTDRDAEFMASSGDAATGEDTTDAAGDQVGGAAPGGAADDSAPSDLDGSAATESAEPTSTLAPAAASLGALADLGEFESVERLLRDGPDDVLARLPDAQGSDTGRSTQFDPQESAATACAAQRSSAGERVLGIATVAGTAVLVVEVDGATVVLELPSCRALS